MTNSISRIRRAMRHYDPKLGRLATTRDTFGKYIWYILALGLICAAMLLEACCG